MVQPIESKAKDARRRRTGFMARLRADTRGNVLMIVAAAILPVLCLIGSGIDLSRAYAAQARMQVACDAAALAGRRAMSAGVVDTAVTEEAAKFFNFNFPQGTFKTAAFTLNTRAKGTEGKDKTTVLVSAETTIPTTIMQVFGFENLPLAVTCNARQDFVNTDIMLVLDVTGSMAQDLGGTTKIVALQNAVMALYKELAPVQAQLEAAKLQLRYGIVPYSSNVNVGKVVRAINSTYIASDNWDYQSRVGRYSHTATGKTKAQCDTLGGSWTRTGGKNSTTGDCVTINDTSAGGTFTWVYQKANHDLSTYVTGASTPVPTRDPGTTANSTWAGCIEERKTLSTITTSTDYSIPSGAYDLNIDMVPTNDKDTKWKPFWPEVSYNRTAGSTTATSGEYMATRGGSAAYVACPTEVKRLKKWTEADLETYVKSLKTIGGTYHDIGMLWGGRMLSRTGVFSADNPETYESMPVSRFLIFLTDDGIAPNSDSYSAYGIETLDQRVTGSSSASGQTARHEQRFKMICNAIKRQNVSIWVISFHASLDPSAALKECATSPTQVSRSSNQAELIAKFVEIGKNIGSLRLTQ
ncbi:TadE/TadG family type IV pilus assembly protein [Sphingomonas sp. KC8]|uniref:TadE/TadG family type IV pilus assembly protein n=1 Tax=Sphingomonas sp. KC8 TaxID=1030157 RepID=UPI000248AB1E|nr:pilus assembly protein TadG-related protein [Sphingomonas sp. KC8]ARS28814.1 hypothetical protein KC8_16170 [Sphingomonas sp. KC8]